MHFSLPLRLSTSSSLFSRKPIRFNLFLNLEQHCKERLDTNYSDCFYYYSGSGSRAESFALGVCVFVRRCVFEQASCSFTQCLFRFFFPLPLFFHSFSFVNWDWDDSMVTSSSVKMSQKISKQSSAISPWWCYLFTFLLLCIPLARFFSWKVGSLAVFTKEVDEERSGKLELNSFLISERKP